MAAACVIPGWCVYATSNVSAAYCPSYFQEELFLLKISPSGYDYIHGNYEARIP